MRDIVRTQEGHKRDMRAPEEGQRRTGGTYDEKQE